MKSFSESYKEAGVDVTAGYKAVELMKAHVAKTMTSGVLSGIGGFGGLFELDMTGIQKPVLVSGTDGVGTKLKIAFLMDYLDDSLTRALKIGRNSLLPAFVMISGWNWTPRIQPFPSGKPSIFPLRSTASTIPSAECATTLNPEGMPLIA